MKEIPITSIPGFAIGQAEDLENATGCTAILCPNGAVASVDVRGGGPATRDTDLLDPKNTVDKIHGVLLSGGSAFGLEAATGVMQYLAEQGIGLPVTDGVKVPIVVQADIFDLSVGNPIWPTVAMGYAAASSSNPGNFVPGSHGAGTGASVGKLFGQAFSMKSGIGSAAFQSGELMVGAIVVVNACGEVFEMDSKDRLAGIVGQQHDMEMLMDGLFEQSQGKNTTIGCVLTNGIFSKGQMHKLASLAQNGLVRTIRPVNMTLDGDTIFAMSTCTVAAQLDVAGMLAVHAVAKAVENAVKSADSAYGLMGYADLKGV